MRTLALALGTGAAMLLATPLDSAAQQGQQPETHIMTITTFHVPLGPERQQFFEYVDTYMVPQTKEDPHVVSFRFGAHNWGGNQANIWLITEYTSLSAIDQSTEWGTAWFEEHYPEGSAAREAADKDFDEMFAPYFSKHTDNIITVNMNRAK